MQTGAEIVPIRPRENTCSECMFREQCLARSDNGCGINACEAISVVPRVHHRGDHLFRAAEAFRNVYMVRAGAVKTYVILHDGEEQVIGFHMPGDVVGLDAIESGRHLCNAMVLDTSCVCPLPFEQLLRLCGRSPLTQSLMMKTLSRRIVDHEALLLILGQKTAEQRMAAFLLQLSTQQHRLGLSAAEINLPMSRADIASYLALAVETVSRVLTRLQEAGLLAVRRNEVRIVDMDRLATLADETLDSRPRRARAGTGLH